MTGERTAMVWCPDIGVERDEPDRYSWNAEAPYWRARRPVSPNDIGQAWLKLQMAKDSEIIPTLLKHCVSVFIDMDGDVVEVAYDAQPDVRIGTGTVVTRKDSRGTR